MKLLLTSDGISTEQIKQELVRLAEKPLEQISVAIINEGHNVEEGDKRWAIDESHDVTHMLGGDVDIISPVAFTPFDH